MADAVKAALLISGADKQRYGRLKEQLANNYLLGTDQYTNTLEKASRILGNYQVAKGPPLEIKGMKTKKEGLYSYSKEPAWDEAAEDEDLRPQGDEQEQETPPVVEKMQQAWVEQLYCQEECRQTMLEIATATIAGVGTTGQRSAQNWQKSSKLSST